MCSPRATSVALGFCAVKYSQAVDNPNDYILWALLHELSYHRSFSRHMATAKLIMKIYRRIRQTGRSSLFLDALREIA
jgi:hypothetical protein